jgi:SHS2 domain-containing protein
MAAMYETFDHTADIGLHVRAATLPDLFAEAGRGLLALLVDDPSTVRPESTFQLRVPGDQPDLLLFDWLSELLYRFETDGFLACEFDVTTDADGLTATVRGEAGDAERHALAHEVKAVTYHQLAVTETDTVWDARVILDI